MFKKSLILLGVISGLVSVGIAQQDAHLTHHSFNSLYFNPAYAGIEQAPNLKMIYRNHDLGYQNSFTDLGDENGAGNSTFLTADMPILPIDGGLGLSIVNDVQPSMRNTLVNLSLSKHVVIGEGKLSIGVQGTANNMLLGRVPWRTPDTPAENDPTIPNGLRDSKTLIDMSAGLWYQSDYKNINKGFYAGLSMSRLLEADFEYSTEGLNEAGSKRHMYVSAGYNIEATYDLVITPNILYKADFGSAVSADGKKKSANQFEIGAKALYQETYWGGLNFRQGDNIGLLIGASFMDRKQLKVGYGIDFNVVGTAAKALTSHEIMVGYYLPKMVKVPKPIIRTPRYKF